MSPKELLDFFKKTHTHIQETIQKKNADYSNSQEDAFRNFKAVSSFGIPPETGFLTRMVDKFSRAANLIQNPQTKPQVTQESLQDTLEDLAAYTVLLMAYLEDKRLSFISPERVFVEKEHAQARERRLEAILNYDGPLYGKKEDVNKIFSEMEGPSLRPAETKPQDTRNIELHRTVLDEDYLLKPGYGRLLCPDPREEVKRRGLITPLFYPNKP